jgi:alpha-D-ribose 1-methylphosphonate 5-triphosphate synthase subunit PhnH
MMSGAATHLAGGFDDPARDAALGFRALMGAMARPGAIEPAAGARPPAPMGAAAGLVALVLCDAETPVWLAPDLAASGVPDWLRFHCGAPIAPERARAMIAFGRAGDLLPLTDWAQGDPEYPDRGATLVLALDAFEGEALTLSGPGVETAAHLPIGPDAGALAAALGANRAGFPLGVDLILTAGDRLAALPRTTLAALARAPRAARAQTGG